ncbi:unnamed protein product [Lymnaea stagnalis]|uniref:Alpha-mannosidase n=1 Tax=Lymnaea stagnalis TaxID=6523 RepID=A0AAV2H1B9_LYMST
MRLSVKKLLQWIFLLILLQVVVYYWSIKRSRRVNAKLLPRRQSQTQTDTHGTCSFKTCPNIKKGVLNVHLVPHSHIDVGWLKTVDQYYTGEIPIDVGQREFGCVRCTLNTTIRELQKNPSRRFSFVEMKYLSRYWNEVDDGERAVIRQLIQERRLELLSGGWVMSDSGVTMYNDIIDQHTLGFDFISETFGPCAHSKTGWHVDQFGHSREHSSLFAQMGYDSLFVGRIDFEDLAERKRSKNMEIVWRASPENLSNQTSLFTHVTFDGYYAPPGFVLDDGAPHPEISDTDAVNFIKIAKQRAHTYKSTHLLLPMGSDFGYKDAERWFNYMDPLIQKVNAMVKQGESSGVHLIYSTPSCYTYYVNQENLTFEVKKDDFLPYSTAPSHFWTGYFTTRGGLKKHIKVAGQVLQSCKQLSIFAGLDESFRQINILRDVMAVMQHHDAITGTQKKHVLKDYNYQLSSGTNECQNVMAQAYKKIWQLTESDGGHNVAPQFCLNLNTSSCNVSEGRQQFLVTLYNPLSWQTDVNVRFPVSFNKLSITDGRGHSIVYQIVPIPDHIKRIPERKTSPDIEVVLQTILPPMSVTTFSVKPEEDGESKVNFPADEPRGSNNIVVENEHLTVTFSRNSGLLISIFNKESSIEESISQEFTYYEGQQTIARFSGAYVFVPKSPNTKRVGGEGTVGIKLVSGELVQEIHQTFSPWVSQIVRLYKGAKYVEFQWIVGPIDDRDNQGKEVVSVFTSTIANGGTFYTDSNGREMMERVKDIRESWNYQPKDYISGNYYPVTSRILIKDSQRNVQLTILTDRPQGGTSLGSGMLELMVHRKLLYDDGLGVAEPLNDSGEDNRGIIFTGKHFLFLETIEKSRLLVKHLAMQIHLEPTLMFTPVNEGMKFHKALKQVKGDEVYLTDLLPDNVQVLTLDRISANETTLYLLRLENVFEVKEFAAEAEVYLETMFRPFDIVSVEETTLGANFCPQDINRLQWRTVDGLTSQSISSTDYRLIMEPPFKVKLKPMEIRTFRIQVARD